MQLGTIFKLSLYGLIAIVGVILGAAEGEGATAGTTRSELYLPYLSVPAAIIGYLVTERLNRGLGGIWANSLGILALIATAMQFNSENREGKLLAGTHLLLYVTWIVLFQRKTIRSYWFLMALGILQLAIASVLTKSGWFGFSAIAYMFFAVWTLSIFSLWRAEQSFIESERRAEDLATREERWTISEVRSAVQHEDGANWLTARFGTGVVTMTFSALLISIVFFAFIPRVWVGPDFSLKEDRIGADRPTSRTVMATTVKLGEMGVLLESKEHVFDVNIVNMHTLHNISVQTYAEQLGLAEPLFRGMVLSRYENGQWSSDALIRIEQLSSRTWRDDSNHDVRQDYRLEQGSTRVLYCLGKPLDALDVENRLIGQYHAGVGVLFRPDTGAVDYSVFSQWPDERQSYFKLGSRPRRTMNLASHLGIPENMMAIRNLAAVVVGEERARRQRLDPSKADLTPLEMASALESYLRDSGEYRYTVDMSVKDPKRDPVEDFLFNRKAGHCEYFASALALMLRSVKIPARVVSGYKGGIEHPEKRHYNFEVQQRFAHLWVEAYFESDEPGWFTFDPTPVAARAESLVGSTSKKSVWTSMQSTFSGLWSENVLNMSLDRQERSIYRPLRQVGYALLTFFQQLFTSPREALDTLKELFDNRDEWFSVAGLMLGLGLCGSLAVIGWLSRMVGRKLLAWFKKQDRMHAKQQRQIVAFYERFSKVVRARGLKREPNQTQQEFAAQVASTCGRELSSNHLDDVPSRISEMFYRVRFGDENLTSEDLDNLESSLSNLEVALNGEANQK